ncbi:MAG: PaeR7I family type II restriction endonuclease [Rhodoferax sp.]|nr:PaeR7I family type II restriction endonuclease [Rhodoferax sp.]
MPLNLCNYESQTRKAIKAFWQTRDDAKLKHKEAGKSDQGERAGVTGGKNMDGFANLVVNLVEANGLPDAQIHQQRALLTLPGYFRPTKLWDLLVIDKGRLVAALEFKSHVGPSFGNNFNNRAEEAIGTSHDLWTAYREGAFGAHERPFVGWLMVVEDALASRTPVKDKSPHFPVMPDFTGASYLKRYDLLCQKLVKEQLYTSASVIATPRTALVDGMYSELSGMTGLRSFVASLAGHIAAQAARDVVE